MSMLGIVDTEELLTKTTATMRKKRKETEELPFDQSKAEPHLPRKALLAVLGDRCQVAFMAQKRPYTYMQIITFYDGIEYCGEGFSKVMFPDEWKPDDGYDIARRRALFDVLHQVRQRESLCKNVDELAQKLKMNLGVQE